MMTAVLSVVVATTIVLALMVDLAALIGWLRRAP
jgi:hypothetical protein